MTDLFAFTPDRPADPPRNPVICQIFVWIGQTFESCDNCGTPFWEHLYEPPVGGQKPLFHVRQWVDGRKEWVWKPVGKLITRERAERCREKWDGYTAWAAAGNASSGSTR
jgi:hypothetical protein